MTDADRASGTSPRDAELRELTAAALDLLDREGEAALEAFLAARPGQSDALRRRLQSLRAYGFTSAAMPERLGGFSLRRRLGGGGMGVVHVAVQDGLQRRVALKLVRPELLLFPGARERFRRELDALARLQHPGIVPVHAGGEDGGVPYLAMELVRGASLEELLAECAGRPPARLTGADLRAAVEAVVARKDAADAADALDGPPAARASGARDPSGSGARTASTPSPSVPALFTGSWTSAAVRIGKAVAEALHHAHEQGVLHRDVKPSNVMLTPAGRVLLLDFGLASAAGSSRLTGTGQMLGSPAYMSPELMDGDAASADARSDVYGLGVTLYELLTLRQPFAGATIEQTRRLVLDAAPPPPRAHNPAVPRDVETVVLVALDKDPPRRYADAAAFAADLDALLERRPVAARRPSALLRVRRWAQRNPAAAVALVATLLLAAGGPLLWAVQQREQNRLVQEQRDEAELQRDRARGNFERAERAVDVLLTQVAEEDLLDVPHLEPVRRRILESALAFYEELLAQDADDLSLRRKLAHVAFRTGYLLVELGRGEEALAVHERVVALVDEIAAREGDDESLADLRADALGGRCTALSLLGRFREAADAAEVALAALRARWAAEPDADQAVIDLDDALSQRAFLASVLGESEASVAAYRELADFEDARLQRAGAATCDPQLVIDAVLAYANMTSVLRELDRVDDAEAAVSRAVELMLPRRAELEAIPTGAQAVASTLLHLGVLLSMQGRRAQGEAMEREAIDVLERLGDVLPNSSERLRLLASAWNNLGKTLLADTTRLDDARAAFEASIEVARQLVAAAPDVPMYVANLAGTLINLGALERDAGRPAAARAWLEESWELLVPLVEAVPEQPRWRASLVFSAWHLGLVCLDVGDAAATSDAGERLARACDGDARMLRIAAGLLARASAASDDPVATSAWRARGLALLDEACARGFDDPDNLRGAQDLGALRGEAAFEACVARAERTRAATGP